MERRERKHREEYLFRNLFDEAPLGIAVEDFDGHLLLANPALCAILGYDRDELQRMSCAAFAHPEDSGDDWALFQKLRSGAIDRYSVEKRYLRKDGAAIWGRLNVSRVKRANGDSPRALALVEEITAHKQAEETRSKHTPVLEPSDDQDITERKRAEKESANLSARFVEAQEQERSHLARELHDDVSQRLALIVVGLDKLREDPPDSEAETRTVLNDLFEQLADISSDVHRLSHRLHPSTLDLGLLPALRSLSLSFERQYGLQVTLICLDLPAPIPKNIALCLYRVAQEALNNVVKHSGVKDARVELVGSPGSLTLRIIDLGRGFAPAVEIERGSGLLSMKERLRLVGGSFKIVSQPSQGTQVICDVPVAQSALTFPAAGA